MSEIELNPEADDQKLMAQVFEYYRCTLKDSPDALEFLPKRGMIASEALEQFRIGYANRTLGGEAHPYIVYDSTPSRTRDGPAEWLQGFEGYLQADAYGGYDGIYSGGRVTEVACWAHARRKFYDAQDSDASVPRRSWR